MMYSQYCRIENKAGGVYAPPRRMIKAFRTFLSNNGKSRECREYRHALVTEMFELQTEAKRIYLDLNTLRSN
jgi:hypothetical protein